MESPPLQRAVRSNQRKKMLNSMSTLWMFFVLGFSRCVGQLFTKATNLLPPGVENCLLEEVQAGINTNFGCIALCKTYPSCSLACTMSDGSCYLYNATVTEKARLLGQTNPKLDNGVCFSSWVDKRDIVTEATFFTTSPLLFHYPEVGGESDGFHCNMLDQALFHTDETLDPWIVGDLQRTRCVEKVVIQTSGLDHHSDHFKNVEVRVGDINGNGSFAANELLMYYEGQVPRGEKVEFKREKPLFGRYVSVQALGSTKFMSFGEIKIIEHL